MSSGEAVTRRRKCEQAAVFVAGEVPIEVPLTHLPSSFIQSFQIRDSQAQTLRALTVKQLHDVSWFRRRSETRAARDIKS